MILQPTPGLGQTIRDTTDQNKSMDFDVSALTSSTLRTWTWQDASDTVVGLATTDILTNKTLTSPVINIEFILNQTTADYTLTWADPAGPTTLTIQDPGGADDFVFASATQTLTNKTLTAPALNGAITSTSGTSRNFNSGDLVETHSADTITWTGDGNVAYQLTATGASTAYYTTRAGAGTGFAGFVITDGTTHFTIDADYIGSTDVRFRYGATHSLVISSAGLVTIPTAGALPDDVILSYGGTAAATSRVDTRFDTVQDDLWSFSADTVNDTDSAGFQYLTGNATSVAATQDSGGYQWTSGNTINGGFTSGATGGYSWTSGNSANAGSGGFSFTSGTAGTTRGDFDVDVREIDLTATGQIYLDTPDTIRVRQDANIRWGTGASSFADLEYITASDYLQFRTTSRSGGTSNLGYGFDWITGDNYNSNDGGCPSGGFTFETGLVEIDPIGTGITGADSGGYSFKTGTSDVNHAADTGGDTGGYSWTSGNALSTAGTSGSTGGYSWTSGNSADAASGGFSWTSGTAGTTRGSATFTVPELRLDSGGGGYAAWDASACTANRTLTMPDAAVDLGALDGGNMGIISDGNTAGAPSVVFRFDLADAAGDTSIVMDDDVEVQDVYLVKTTAAGSAGYTATVKDNAGAAITDAMDMNNVVANNIVRATQVVLANRAVSATQNLTVTLAAPGGGDASCEVFVRCCRV